MARVFLDLDRLGAHSINHTEMGVICVSSAHIPSLLKLASKLPTLKGIVSLEPLLAEAKTILSAWGEQVGIKVMELSEGMVIFLRNEDDTHSL